MSKFVMVKNKIMYFNFKFIQY